jgi:serine phosphatase RsbU (regulator of sigma subunit)
MQAAFLRYQEADGTHKVELDRPSTTLGRSSEQDFRLLDPLVSRQHAVIERRNDVWVVVDKGSTHGTFLNSVRVQRAVLNSGDLLQLGSLNGQKLHFQLAPLEETLLQGESSGIRDLLGSIREFATGSGEPRPAAREMEQLNWMLRAARQLNEGVAIDEILAALLRLTLQLTGVERGFVYLWRDGVMRFAQGLGAAGRIDEEDLTISRGAIRKAIESNSTFLVSDTLSDQVTSEWASVMINAIRSIYCIPLRKRVSAGEPAQLLGLLYLDSQLVPGSLTEIDQQLLETISSEAAALLQNALLASAEQTARKAREELVVAARIHSGLMSTALPVLSYAQIAARTVPCNEIGGDFYDVIELADCVCAAIVDISGKGVSAAIVAATLQGIIHVQLLAGVGLAQIAAVVNQFLCTRNVGKYATMVIVKLFTEGRIEYINCGHIQPFAILGTTMRRLPESNLIVGLIEGATYAAGQDVLQPGERILLMTDGITEAENSAGELFDERELTAVAPTANLEALLEHVARFHAPNPAQDDCTLIEIQYTGAT